MINTIKESKPNPMDYNGNRIKFTYVNKWYKS